MTDHSNALPREVHAPDSSDPSAAPRAWKAPELREIPLSDTAGGAYAYPAELTMYGPAS